jgi:hypothetical protein
MWSSPRGGEAQTGSVEEWSLKHNCAGGRSFLWLDAYRQKRPDGGGARFRIVTRRAEMQVGAGAWFDITPGGACGREGHPMALQDVPRETYSLRVWGDILMADGVTVGRRFFWQSTMSYHPAVENPCWKGEDRVRPAVRQQEAWWDSAKGWTIGSGRLGANGEPDGARVRYTRWNMTGKGAGQGWQGELQNGARLCLVGAPP